MFKKKFFLILFLVLAISVVPLFADGAEKKQSKRYDLMFSLAGGNIGGKFTLTGNFLYAQEFGAGFFQVAGFADIKGSKKEYGTSAGIGANANDGVFCFYLFGDSLYSQENWWFQIRPTVRIRTKYLGITGFYAFPVSQKTIQIGNENVGAAKYFGGKAEIVPVNWMRIYGNLMSVEKTYTRYTIGGEIRLFKWISVSAAWNKTDPGLYSNWGSYDDFSVALNVLFGAKQQSFSPTHRVAVTPMYPILAAKKEKPEPNPNELGGEVEFKYVRVREVTDPNERDVTTCALHIFSLETGVSSAPDWKEAEDGWVTSIYLICQKGSYWAWTSDWQTGTKEAIARKLFARVKGDSEWIELTKIVSNPVTPGEAVKFKFNHGRIEN